MAHRPKSQKLYSDACLVLPGGVNSPIRACKAVSAHPIVVESAHGDTLTDLDGYHYIDYCCSWGALIHGHSHPAICAEAHRKMIQGSSFGVLSPIEAKIASTVASSVHSAEKVRFVSSGTEATMSAIRLARAFTHRDLIVKFDGHYHGHADHFLVKAGSGAMECNGKPSSAGIPHELIKYTISLPFNDAPLCQKILLDPSRRDRIAALIVEPIAANMGVVPPSEGFLNLLRQLTREIGALLIFDEVITGFRVGLGGAQQLYDITPDLSCFGKIIGGGFPAAAFAGRNEIMNHLSPLGEVFQAGTLSGNPVAMGAGLCAIEICKESNFYSALEAKTRLLTDPVEKFLSEHPTLQCCIQRVGSMFTLFFGRRSVANMEEAQQCDSAQFAKFFHYMCEQGIYIPPLQWEAWFVSSAHTSEHLVTTADKIIAFLEEL